MRLNVATFFLVFFPIFLVLSCTTAEEGPVTVTNRPYVIKQLDDKLPPNLWSPSRRAGYSYYYYLSGEMSLLSGKFKDATKHFDVAYALRPNSFTGAKLITAHAYAGNRVDSLAESRKMVLLYPKSSDLRVLYGNVLVQNGTAKKAAQEFERAIDLDPENREAYLAAIGVYSDLKKDAEALKVASRYKENLPSDANAYLWEAKLKLRLKDSEGALEAVTTAFEMQPANPSILIVYAYTLELNQKSKNAVQIYERLFRLFPDSLDLAGRLVALYKELGSLEAAYDVLEGTSLRLREPVAAVEVQKLFILWDLKKFEKSIPILEILLDEFSEKDQIKYIVGYGYVLAEKLENAVEVLKKIPTTSPLRAPAVVFLAESLHELKRIEEAEGFVEELKTLEFEKATIMTYASDFYARSKNYRKAIEFLVAGIEKFPNYYRFRFLKGVYEEKLGDLEACMQTLKDLIELVPDHAAALNFLGYMYAEQGVKLEQAFEYLKVALEKEPQNGFYLDSMGWILFKMNRLESARDYLEKAFKVEPEEGVILEHLGEVDIKEGKIREGLEKLRASLKLRLSEKDKKRVEDRIRELEKSEAEDS